MRKHVGVLVVAAVMSATVLLGFAGSAGAAGAVQLSALGTPGDTAVCPLDSDFPILITGASEGWSLDGCLYQTFGPGHGPTPAGTYQETGTEHFVGELWFDGDPVGSGTFDTTYVFTAKFIDGDFAKEVFGRCQHPVVDGSGTGVFADAAGRLDFKDSILERDEDGNVLDVEFPMRGHLRLANGS